MGTRREGRRRGVGRRGRRSWSLLGRSRSTTCCNGLLLLSSLKLLPPKLENLSLMVEGVFSDDAVLQLESMTQFRKLQSDFEPLAEDRCPPIHEVVRTGVVPRFVEFLEQHSFSQLQLEAAWALTNIASGDLKQTQLVIELGAIPKFVRLLSSSAANVREQAVWALGNIAGDSPSCRDLVLNYGALYPLICQLDRDPKVSMLRITAWALSNLCRWKPPP